MASPLRINPKVRRIFSKGSSLLLLFQRTPIVQMILPEARVMGTTGVGELVKWTVATVAGLGVYDTVAGATTMAQIAPTPVVTPLNAKAGTSISLTVQVTGAPGNPGSWQISSGSLPPGISKTSSGSTCTMSGIPTTAGTFNFTLKAWENSGNSGGSISKAFSIAVAAVIPVITANPASSTINSGGTATLSVTASGTSPTFQWYKGTAGNTANPVSGATSASYTTPALTATTSYWVKATNSAGSDNSTAATITVRIPPAFTTHPASATLNSGTTTTLIVSASGTSPTFQWYVGNSGVTTSPISGATSNSYTPPALTATTSYWVKATNAAGTASSNTAKLTVITPPAITGHPASVTINRGDTATLTAGASGTSPTFQWYVGNSGDTSNPVPNATSVSFTTPVLTASTSYWARAANAAGSVDSNAALVTVVSPVNTFADWQASQFSTTQLADTAISGPAADPDGDGIGNDREYVFGLMPLTADPTPAPAIVASAGQLLITFTAKAASGTGYTGKTRHYALEYADNLISGAWSSPAGYEDIIANDQNVNYNAATGGTSQFYHLRVWLTP